MSHWDNPEECVQRCIGIFGLDLWLARIGYLFDPVCVIVACGTYSDPIYASSPVASVKIINAGIKRTFPHDCRWWNYSLCAWQAGLAYAMDQSDWDLLVVLDTDCLVGAVDFDMLLRDFMKRPDEVLSPAWCGCWIGGPFLAFKRHGISRWLNSRLRANLISPNSGPEPMLPEEEMTRIFEGRWWNPWPQINSCRQDYGEEAEAQNTNGQAMTWPFLRKPHPAIIDRYIAEQSSAALPVTLTETAPYARQDEDGPESPQV